MACRGARSRCRRTVVRSCSAPIIRRPAGSPPVRPRVLGADNQRPAGYPLVGVVITADRPLLGQLRPGADVRLRAIRRDEALAALREQRMAFAAGVGGVPGL